jgi:hypothetical protein
MDQIYVRIRMLMSRSRQSTETESLLSQKIRSFSPAHWVLSGVPVPVLKGTVDEIGSGHA